MDGMGCWHGVKLKACDSEGFSGCGAAECMTVV